MLRAKVFTGQPDKVERDLNEWLTPDMDIETVVVDSNHSALLERVTLVVFAYDYSYNYPVTNVESRAPSLVDALTDRRMREGVA